MVSAIHRWNSTCLCLIFTLGVDTDLIISTSQDRERFILVPLNADPLLPPPGYPAEIPSPRKLSALHSVMVRCTRCDLFLSRLQVVPGDGAAKADYLFVGEAPGASEDRTGIPFAGRSGALLDSMLERAGLDRREVFIANVVRCRPPENRNPRASEIRACAGWMRAQVRLVSPTVVVTLGRFALQHFLPSGRITRIQGEVQRIDYFDRKIALYPLFHPAAVLRNPELRPVYTKQFEGLPKILGEAKR
jgi:uracil-DNA glycosylase family 4